MKREENRAAFPEFAAIKDELGESCRFLHIEVDGVTVAGKPPAPDNTVTISAGFYLMACNLGAKK